MTAANTSASKRQGAEREGPQTSLPSRNDVGRRPSMRPPEVVVAHVTFSLTGRKVFLMRYLLSEADRGGACHRLSPSMRDTSAQGRSIVPGAARPLPSLFASGGLSLSAVLRARRQFSGVRTCNRPHGRDTGGHNWAPQLVLRDFGVCGGSGLLVGELADEVRGRGRLLQGTRRSRCWLLFIGAAALAADACGIDSIELEPGGSWSASITLWHAGHAAKRCTRRGTWLEATGAPAHGSRGLREVRTDRRVRSPTAMKRSATQRHELARTASTPSARCACISPCSPSIW